MDEMGIVLTRLDAIEKKCQEMELAIEAFGDYSYKNNRKIVGQRKKLPSRQPICAYVFSLLSGLKISQYQTSTRPIVFPQDEHRTNPTPSSTRRLPKDKVMAARRKVFLLQGKDLGFEENVQIQGIALFDHLSPRLQTLLCTKQKSSRMKMISSFAGLREALYSYARRIHLMSSSSPVLTIYTHLLGQKEQVREDRGKFVLVMYFLL